MGRGSQFTFGMQSQGNADPTAPALPLLHGQVPWSLLKAQTGVLAHVGHSLLFPPPKPLVSPCTCNLGGCWGVNLTFLGCTELFPLSEEEGFAPQTQPSCTRLKHDWGVRILQTAVSSGVSNSPVK